MPTKNAGNPPDAWVLRTKVTKLGCLEFLYEAVSKTSPGCDARQLGPAVRAATPREKIIVGSWHAAAEDRPEK